MDVNVTLVLNVQTILQGFAVLVLFFSKKNYFYAPIFQLIGKENLLISCKNMKYFEFSITNS